MSNEGFYTALGTPLDQENHIVHSSLSRHVEDQIGGGAAGLLLMGSMGMQASIRDSEFAEAVKTAVQAVKGACPLFVGVMDNSIARVKDRIDSLRGLDIDGVVATTPFYFRATQEQIRMFYRSIAELSPYPVYMYDLPGVTQSKIEAETALHLMAIPNIAGVKTGDLALARVLHRSRQDIHPAFEVIFSGLDIMDAAYGYGITKCLDGMFSCTLPAASAMSAAWRSEDAASAANCLDQIVGLRDVFVEVGVFPGFTCAMNLLGYEGMFHPDYIPELTPQQVERVSAYMRQQKWI